MSDKQFDNINRVSLWEEELPKKNAKGPDFTGTVNIEGVDYRVSVWKKLTAKGRKMLSGSVQPVEARAVTKSAAKPASGEEDDVPW